MEFSNYVQTLGTLLSLPHSVHTARAASHLVAREFVKANPIPSPAECDAELTEAGIMPAFQSALIEVL